MTQDSGKEHLNFNRGGVSLLTVLGSMSSHPDQVGIKKYTVLGLPIPRPDLACVLEIQFLSVWAMEPISWASDSIAAPLRLMMFTPLGDHADHLHY